MPLVVGVNRRMIYISDLDHNISYLFYEHMYAGTNTRRRYNGTESGESIYTYFLFMFLFTQSTSVGIYQTIGKCLF